MKKRGAHCCLQEIACPLWVHKFNVQNTFSCPHPPPTRVRAAALADLHARMRSNAKLSAGLKRSWLRGGGARAPCAPLDPLVYCVINRGIPVVETMRQLEKRATK